MSSNSHVDFEAHVALLPSAGMGHLLPCLRLAASLLRHDCRVTLITPHPTVSDAESHSISTFLSAFPQVTGLKFHLLPLDPTSVVGNDDPFFLQWEAINRSAHLLPPLLSSISSPPSAFVVDVTLASSVLPLTTNLNIPMYVLFISSARMCSLFLSYPSFVASETPSDFVTFSDNKDLDIPISSIPPPILDLNHPFAIQFLKNAGGAMKSNGVLVNTFEALEGDALHALNAIKGFPKLYAVGPLLADEFERRENRAAVKWLDDQPDGSVVYVSFGSRSVVSREQMKEIGKGLVRSGFKFLWVVKDKKVDKEDGGESLEELLGSELMGLVEKQGMVIRTWVDQDEVLGHKGVGGFLSHCGSNTIIETAWHGMRMLMWPLNGDQKICAEVVERNGYGLWIKNWGWNDQQMVIKAEDIGQGIKDMMESDELKINAGKIREEARKAVGIGGSTERTLKKLIQEWSQKISI